MKGAQNSIPFLQIPWLQTKHSAQINSLEEHKTWIFRQQKSSNLLEITLKEPLNYSHQHFKDKIMNTTALPKIFQFEEHIRTQSIFALSSLF